MKLAIIGGSGLAELDGMVCREEKCVETPFGTPSSPLRCGEFNGTELVFLSRHGDGHVCMPSEINYRANIFALKTLGITHILSISAVGSLKEAIRPRDVVIVDQYFDRTKNGVESSTFFGGGIVGHIAMAQPVCPELSELAFHASQEAIVASDAPQRRVIAGGTYVNMAGPAFSTLAESEFYRSCGASVIGMTNLYEAKLAREAEICYCTVAMVTDYDCWHPEHDSVTIDMVIGNLRANTALSCDIIRRVAAAANGLPRNCPCPDAVCNAIITDRKAIPKERKKALQPLWGKYL